MLTVRIVLAQGYRLWFSSIPFISWMITGRWICKFKSTFTSFWFVERGMSCYMFCWPWLHNRLIDNFLLPPVCLMKSLFLNFILFCLLRNVCAPIAVVFYLQVSLPEYFLENFPLKGHFLSCLWLFVLTDTDNNLFFKCVIDYQSYFLSY